MPSLLSFLRGGPQRPNAALAPLRITLARRLVETAGAVFVESPEVFTDVASARDELGFLPASQGPTVVRVRVEGGTASEQEALEGDWLVDPDTGGRVARLPKPLWTYSAWSTAWASNLTWLEAWETCFDARWMLHAAGGANVDRRLMARAACVCTRDVLPLVRLGNEQLLRALEAIDRWVRGEATHDELEAVVAAARSANGANIGTLLDDDNSNDADRAAYHAAYAVSYTLSVPYDNPIQAGGYAASVAAYASAATAGTVCGYSQKGYSYAIRAAKSRYAEFVRSVIPTLAVLRAVATRAEHLVWAAPADAPATKAPRFSEG